MPLVYVSISKYSDVRLAISRSPYVSRRKTLIADEA
jgi:hypothetical protein